MKNDFQEIKELINELIEISSKQLNNLNEEVKSLFYKLLNYCYTFNNDLASDYENIYKEYYCDEDIKIISKNKENYYK